MIPRTFSFIVLIFCLSFSCSCTSKKKEITTFVFDKEGVLTETQEKQFDNLFREHERRTTNEIFLVTTPDYQAEKDISSYALNFFNSHGIGKKELNNGVAIVFSKAKRGIRITTGYGTEEMLKDEIAGKILDSLVVPQLKQGNIFDGLWAGSNAVVEFLDKPQNRIIKKRK